MGFINVAERTINAKLVYYGVGVGGKTTSLQQVHGIFCPRNEVKLVSISTEEDSTLMFDFLPINLGNVGGFKIRIQGYTVPGQPKYRQMRKLVLQGADAVVFVVDSQRSRLQENIESMQSMRDSLRSNSGTSEDIPIVLQYNKRDLDDLLSEAELDRAFRFRDDIEAFPTVATEGHGVFEAFVHAAGMLIESKVELYGLGGDGTEA
ncbi:MAG: GTPase, partial [Planctomycetes bacterium]|nr:GTPase [Planctomycetota bacterium]